MPSLEDGHYVFRAGDRRVLIGRVESGWLKSPVEFVALETENVKDGDLRAAYWGLYKLLVEGIRGDERLPDLSLDVLDQSTASRLDEHFHVAGRCQSVD